MDSANVDDRVWYDDNPGIVRAVNRGSALVRWDNDALTIVALSDLVKMTDMEANTSFRSSTEQPIQWTELPTWVIDPSIDSPQVHAFAKVLWTRSDASDHVFYGYWPDGSFMAQWARR